jgi:hypothetical protein
VGISHAQHAVMPASATGRNPGWQVHQQIAALCAALPFSTAVSKPLLQKRVQWEPR